MFLFKQRYYVSEYSNDMIHQIYCFNTLTNVLKRAELIGDVNTTYDRDSIRYKSTNLHSEILQKTLLSTIEYDRNALLLTIVNLVFKMYRNGILSAETEVRN